MNKQEVLATLRESETALRSRLPINFLARFKLDLAGGDLCRTAAASIAIHDGCIIQSQSNSRSNASRLAWELWRLYLDAAV